MVFSILIFAVYIILIRYLDLETQWLANHFSTVVFYPKNYASSFISPSLGAFFLNVLAITWLVCYIYSYRNRIRVIWIQVNRLGGILIYIGFGILVYSLCWGITDVFKGLIINSSINFDVTNVLKLNQYSWIGIISLCFAVLDLYLLIEILLIFGTL